MRSELYTIENLKIHFPILKGVIFKKTVGYVKAVDGVSFTIFEGETLGLVGESGCGKSTTGRGILNLIRSNGGSIKYENDDISHLYEKDLRKLRKNFQIIFQDPYSSLNPRLTAGEIISEPLKLHTKKTREEIRKEVLFVMNEVGLGEQHYERYPNEFSGGQRQRIGIARAIILRPKFIVCDEPVSALDVSIQAQIINLLKKLQDKYKLTYLFISHDLSVVKHISDRIAVMYLGKIVELNTSDNLYNSPIHPYTKALLSSIPLPDPKKERSKQKILLEGDVPSSSNPPLGCNFCNRCPTKMDVMEKYNIDCDMVEPELMEKDSGNLVACHWN